MVRVGFLPSVANSLHFPLSLLPSFPSYHPLSPSTLLSSSLLLCLPMFFSIFSPPLFFSAFLCFSLYLLSSSLLLCLPMFFSLSSLLLSSSLPSYVFLSIFSPLSSSLPSYVFLSIFSPLSSSMSSYVFLSIFSPSLFFSAFLCFSLYLLFPLSPGIHGEKRERRARPLYILL